MLYACLVDVMKPSYQICMQVYMCTNVTFLDAVMWSREDALGAIAAVEMLDLPAGQSEQIEAFVEMTKSEGNPLKVFALRAQLQFTLAKVRSSRESLKHRHLTCICEADFNCTRLLL